MLSNFSSLLKELHSPSQGKEIELVLWQMLLRLPGCQSRSEKAKETEIRACGVCTHVCVHEGIEGAQTGDPIYNLQNEAYFQFQVKTKERKMSISLGLVLCNQQSAFNIYYHI